jgi:SAM-dependent methyltransferase
MKVKKWGQKNVIDYYSKNRNKVSDLYKSEKYLLSKIKKTKKISILDFGCATGGFLSIFKKLFYNVTYTGIDSDRAMLRIAKKKNVHKNYQFIFSNSINKKIKKHDLVFSTGVIHHIKNYKNIINSMIFASDKYIFIDCPRLHLNKKKTAKMDLSIRFEGNNKKNIVNYYVENMNVFFIFLKTIYKKTKHSFFIYIDILPYSKKYLDQKNKIFFASILIVKDKLNNMSLVSPNKSIKKKINAIFKK